MNEMMDAGDFEEEYAEDRRLNVHEEHDADSNEFAGADNGDASNWFLSNAKNEHGKGMISTIFQCQTDLATHLCIYAPASKLVSNIDERNSIGGTYSQDNADFWFYLTTSSCHGGNYLLKIFVIPRRDVRFSLYIPSVGHNLTKQIKVHETDNTAEITGSIKECIFTSSWDEVIFVKTYCFSKDDLQILGHRPLLLPCAIEIHYSYKMHPDVVNKIKLKYTVEQNMALYKTKCDGDFTIESRTGKKHPVHLFVAAAHSPVLRNCIRDNKKTFCIDCSDEDVEAVVEFLYNGSVENLAFQNATKILELACLLDLPGMMQLGQIVLNSNMNKDNAVEIAILAKKYNLGELSSKVFTYIKQNPDLLCGSIKNLNDIELMRDMLKFISNSQCHCKQAKST